jgi:hypothetical protein
MNRVCRTVLAFQSELLSKVFSFLMMFILADIASKSGLFTTPAYAQQGAAKATVMIETVSNSSATRGKKLEVTYLPRRTMRSPR